MSPKTTTADFQLICKLFEVLFVQMVIILEVIQKEFSKTKMLIPVPIVKTHHFELLQLRSKTCLSIWCWCYICRWRCTTAQTTRETGTPITCTLIYRKNILSFLLTPSVASSAAYRCPYQHQNSQINVELHVSEFRSLLESKLINFETI